MSTTIGPIDPLEVKTVYFKFEKEARGKTITGASVNVTVVNGADPLPNEGLRGAVVIDNVSKVVAQKVGFATQGNTYLLKALATDEDGNIHAVTATLGVSNLT
jgi:hypothetical protein